MQTSRPLSYNQRLHLLQLALCLLSKAGYFHHEAQINLIEVLLFAIWVTSGHLRQSICVFACECV